MGPVEELKFNLPSSRPHNSIPTYILHKMKHLVIFETVFGINRLFFYNYRKSATLLSYIYCTVLATICLLFMLREPFSSSIFLYKDIKHIEYIILSLSAMFLQKKNLMIFFRKLHSYDQMLKIDTEDTVTTFGYLSLIFGATLLYNIMEYIFFLIFIYSYFTLPPTSMFLYIPINAQDIETIFFCLLIVIVMRRLHVLKNHVAKIRCKESNEIGQQIDKFKELSKKVNLDISTLHKVYDLLHQCFEELNSIISFPIIVILTTSAMSMIALLKRAYMLFKNGYNLYGPEDEEFYSLFYIFVLLRCLKTSVIMMFPCYFSHVTKNQAAIIRSMLYDILSNTNPGYDKTTHRKLKAFLLLTHENTFSYALWGIIKFDLSLPLSFYNLCITYLIISIQFSKIID